MSTLTMGEELRAERSKHLRRVKVAAWIINAIALILGAALAVLIVG